MIHRKIFSLWGWLKVLRDDAVILYYAWKHPSTPEYVKGLLVVLVAYLFSPIDILPDYLPLIGIADDVTLLSAAVLYLNRLLPEPVRLDCQKESMKWQRRMPILLGIVIIFALSWTIFWIALAIKGINYIFS